MDILEKLNKILIDTTAHAGGSVDMSQGPYGGMRQRKRKKKKECQGGEDIVTELAAFMRRRKKEKQTKLKQREMKLRQDRYKLSPSEIKQRKENLAAAKARARRLQGIHEGKYKVTVIVKSLNYKKTFSVDAPTEGKAKTRAMNQAMGSGLRLAGEFVEYKINEKRAMSISGQKAAGKMKMDMDTKRKDLAKRGFIGDKKKKTFEEWMKLYFPDEKEAATKEKKAKKKLQTAKINLDAFKKMRG